MKIINKIGMAAALVMTAFISSCSDKGYWDEAPLEPGYSFDAANYSEELKPGPQEIKLTLHRSVNAAEESVDVTFTPGNNCPKDITVQSPVVFAAGSTTAEVVINIANAMPPYTYSGKLTFNGEPSYAGISSCTLNMPVSYTWVSMGKGQFLDAFVMGDTPCEAEILKAEGFERYRVVNPYVAYYENGGREEYEEAGMYGNNGPEFIEFWQNSKGLLSYNMWFTGLLYQGKEDQPIGAYPWSAFTNGVEGFDIWYQPGFAVLSPIYYIDGVGGYGQQKYAVQIFLPQS